MNQAEKFAAVIDLAAGMQREMQDSADSVEAVMRFASVAAQHGLSPDEIPEELFLTAVNLAANFGRLLAEQTDTELAAFWQRWRENLGPE